MGILLRMPQVASEDARAEAPRGALDAPPATGSKLVWWLRGTTLLERIRELATGEIFSGRQALAAGLADQLGSLEDAVKLAAEAAGVAPRWRWAGRKRSLGSRLIGRLAGQAADALWERAVAAAFPEPRY